MQGGTFAALFGQPRRGAVDVAQMVDSMSDDMKAKMCKIDMLVLDEVGTTAPWWIDAYEEVARHVRCSTESWGGMQVLVPSYGLGLVVGLVLQLGLELELGLELDSGLQRAAHLCLVMRPRVAGYISCGLLPRDTDRCQRLQCGGSAGWRS